jgi:hypothetical protein
VAVPVGIAAVGGAVTVPWATAVTVRIAVDVAVDMGGVVGVAVMIGDAVSVIGGTAVGVPIAVDVAVDTGGVVGVAVTARKIAVAVGLPTAMFVGVAEATASAVLVGVAGEPIAVGTAVPVRRGVLVAVATGIPTTTCPAVHVVVSCAPVGSAAPGFKHGNAKTWPSVAPAGIVSAHV